jgi:hypothetical protein
MDKSGNRYSATPPYQTSGSGWNEITVACIDGERVVLSSSDSTNAGTLGNNEAAPPLNPRSFVAPLNDPGDYWMEPAKLAAMRTDSAKRIVVTRGPWTIGGHTTDTIRVQVTRPQFYWDKVYDAKTGLCIHWATAIGGMGPINALTGSARGRSTLKHGDLVGTRDLMIPWAKDATPDSVSDMRSIEYQGSQISRGSKLILPYAITIDMTTTERGDGWIAMTTKSISEGAGTPIGIAEDKFASGRSQFGGMWIGTASIGLLLRGEVLDEDPITKVKISVTKEDEKSVTISAVNAAGEVDWQYDRKTGMLIGMKSYNTLSDQQTTLQMLSHK